MAGATSARAAGLLEQQATVHGFTVAFWWAAAMLILSGVISAALINSGPRTAPHSPGGPGGAPLPAATH